MKKLYTVIFILLALQGFAVPPTVPASNLSFNTIDGGFFNLGWTPGNGARRVIICKAGSPVSFVPQNGTDYVENTIFGSGQQVAPGEFVVYDNAFTSFFVTGLSPATQYFFAVFEYNGTGATSEYLTGSFLTANASTSAMPTIQVSNAVFTTITANSVNFTWTSGNGQRRLIVIREGSPVNADPVISHQYAVSSVFGNGEMIGTGNFTVYSSSDAGSSVTNLQPGTQYFFSFYEYNGSGQPQYKIPAYTASVTTRSMPTSASSNIVITKVDGKELGLAWTNGNGQRRIIVAKKGSAITGQPANGVDYAANPVFGQGPQLAAGEFIVYDDNFNATTISGLEPASTYFFKIFEYDGAGADAIYLTALFAATSAGTAARPTVQSTNISVDNITANSLNLVLTAGNGRARFVVGHKNTLVNAGPIDFITYASNGDFGTGQDLGGSNFAISTSTDVIIGIHNLEPNTTYHFAVFELNGFNQPLYLSPAAVINATTAGVVPVRLTTWEAIAAQGAVTLQWITATEINSSHFTIERSSDAVNFLAIATVSAMGNSGMETHYIKEDTNPFPGTSFYRLKMVDLDGQATYSPVRTVIFTQKLSAVIAGNPVQHTLEIRNITLVNGENEWQIMTVMGQVIKKGKATLTNIQVDIAGIPAGTYWLRLFDHGKWQTLSFVKL